jgi:hypothetical protein
MGTLIGTIVGVAGVVVGVLTYLHTREDRHLDYQIVINTQLLHPGAATLPGWLRLSYADTWVVDPYLIVVRLVNTGNRPIRPEDQVEPIRIEFDHTVTVLYAEVVGDSPVRTDIYLESHHVRIPPVLFNQGDWIAIKLLTEPEGKLSIQGRIVGVREFRPYSPAGYTGWERWLPLWASIAASVLYGLVVVAILNLFHLKLPELPTAVSLGLILGGPVLFVASMLVVQGYVDRRVHMRGEGFRVDL